LFLDVGYKVLLDSQHKSYHCGSRKLHVGRTMHSPCLELIDLALLVASTVLGQLGASSIGVEGVTSLGGFVGELFTGPCNNDIQCIK
jgi:hypothetical protein